MWVFGYGSLMWDGWEAPYGCLRRTKAELRGYCRAFNKASVRNWGSKGSPGPTLNLRACETGACQGIAFEFSWSEEETVLSYLSEREGAGFKMHRLKMHLEDGAKVTGFVGIYAGKNLIDASSVAELASMVRTASGTAGSCLNYVEGVAEKLSAMGIDDVAVSELRNAIMERP